MKVLGFPIDYNEENGWGYSEMRDLTAHQKYELALEDDRITIYDNEQDWADDLNTDLVDTENTYWFIIDD